MVQCDSGDDNFNLIAGARHILLEERTNAPEMLNLPSIEAVHIVLVIQLPRMVGGCRNFVGFQGGKWMSSHIDELRPPDVHTPSIEQLTDHPISELFKSGSKDQEEGDEVTQALAVKILRNCVQAAACRVDNETESSERSTQRIELLLDLLPDDSHGERGWFVNDTHCGPFSIYHLSTIIGFGSYAPFIVNNKVKLITKQGLFFCPFSNKCNKQV